LRTHGAEELRALVDRSPGIVEFLIDSAAEGARAGAAERASAVERLGPVLAGVDNSVEIDMYIERIAQRFGIALSQLKEVNSIPARLRSLVGLTILVPTNGEQAGGDVADAGFATHMIAPVAVTAAAAAHAAKHVVRAGETLASIAQRYRVSVAQLAARNGIRNGKILAGQSLQIGEAPAQAAHAAEKSSRSAPAAKAVRVKNEAAPKARTTTRPKSAPKKPPVSAKSGDAPAKSTEATPQRPRTQVAYTGGEDHNVKN
jgi:LysM repeat protein